MRACQMASEQCLYFSGTVRAQRQHNIEQTQPPCSLLPLAASRGGCCHCEGLV